MGTLHTTARHACTVMATSSSRPSIDHLRYPDGSDETRVEAEGDEESVEAFSRELERAVAGLVPAATTKGAELAKRLGETG